MPLITPTRFSRSRLFFLLLSFLFFPSSGYAANMFDDWVNKLMEAGFGILYFQKHFDKLPDDIRDEQNHPILSWRVAVLPFLEQMPLFRQMEPIKPWNDPANLAFVSKCPAVFRCPLVLEEKTYEESTPIAMARGNGTFFAEGGHPIKRIPGPEWSKKVMLVTMALGPKTAKPWTEPGDWQFDPQDSHRGLANFWGGCFAVFGDGKVRIIPPSLDSHRMRQIMLLENEEEPLPLELNWYQAMLQTDMGLLLWPLTIFSMITWMGSVWILVRFFREKTASPGEFLWIIMGAQQVMFFLALVFDYRYDYVPLARWEGSHRPYWCWPLFVAAAASLAGGWVSRKDDLWRKYLRAFSACYLGIALLSWMRYQHFHPNEGLKCLGAPNFQLVAGLFALALTTTDRKPRNFRDRLIFFSGIFVFVFPFFWSQYWVEYHRELFDRILD